MEILEHSKFKIENPNPILPLNISSIDEVIKDIRLGNMVILVDDPDRENEGDFIVSAHFLTNNQMTQMIRFGSGIVCVVIDENIRQKFQLSFQEKRGRGQASGYVNFLTSIEASDDIGSGVSAQDRVTTIKTLLDPNASPASLTTPGHIFPLLANPGGLEARKGHTEASLALMKCANLPPCAVLCEIMNDDGTMSRLPNLIEMANKLGLKIGTIKDLENYIKNFFDIPPPQ